MVYLATLLRERQTHTGKGERQRPNTCMRNRKDRLGESGFFRNTGSTTLWK